MTTAVVFLFATTPVLQSQSSRSLEWRLEQQPTSAPCTPEDIAFVNAPEQVLLEKSYNLLPSFPEWRCKSIKAPALNDARVLIVSKPSTLDDGVTYALIQPHNSPSIRLLPLGGGMVPMPDEGGWHNIAAMNAILQSKQVDGRETIDWLGICLAYLTILEDAPSLGDEHYSGGRTDRCVRPYAVPGLLSELPALTRKHLLPTLACDESDYCTVHFYYRTEPVERLKVADFVFHLQVATLSLLRASVQEFASDGGKKRSHN